MTSGRILGKLSAAAICFFFLCAASTLSAEQKETWRKAANEVRKTAATDFRQEKMMKDSRPGCPDLAAVAIEFSIVSRAEVFRGRVRITGKIKNIGGVTYESGARQQSAQLYEAAPGQKPKLVASKKFQNLGPNQGIDVVYERDWHSGSPVEGEFPPTYELKIHYDAATRRDRNSRNDDCNDRNNVKRRGGDDINAMFTR